MRSLDWFQCIPKVGVFRCTSRNVRAAITVNLIAVTLNTLFATPQSREERLGEL